MGLIRVICCLAACFSAASAHALPEFWELFKKHYQPTAGSAIARETCVTCHTAKEQFTRNPYGLQVQQLVEVNPAKRLTIAMLQQLESQDANGDGVSNGEEIRKGSLPGAVAKKAEQNQGELIPPHSFHPALVHFPIALFIFGALLDFWGWRKGRAEARAGAAFALWIGALSSLVALPTGVAAWLRIGFPLEGVTLIHLILAVSASVLMIGIANVRRKVDLDSTGYWAALAVATILIGATGHFGSMMVYN